ncbi:hypothetical protein M569_04504, partial [Genlisea aurea]
EVSSLSALLSITSESLEKLGDPCLPVTWNWVSCSSTAPPRITKILLSSSNLNGEIPKELNNLDGLIELWLDGNSLRGPIPDLSGLMNLKILHLENNEFSGQIPSYLGKLPNLRELYVQNNSLSGQIPPSLFKGSLTTFNYSSNPHLRRASRAHSVLLAVGISFGVVVFLLALCISSLLFLRRSWRNAALQRNEKGDSWRGGSTPLTGHRKRQGGSLTDEGVAYYVPLSVIEEATDHFSKKIGKGSFGPVYYGKLKSSGKEVAVKIMADTSSHGNKQFATEVALLSRIHHRNLVPLIGYCEEKHQRMLVYEYMHNGTLRDHLHDPENRKHLDWLTRLRIAEDAAKGLEYLHTGCNPSIIHRDVKTSNILLDANMRGKVSDFGLSRQAEEEEEDGDVSSVARGTLGYLDPEYYVSRQLSEKSDVYSFGVVLLELISGRKPISLDRYDSDWTIVHWARSNIRRGDVMSMVDPKLAPGTAKVESIWRIAEVAIQCVEQHGYARPSMQETVSTIQDAIKIETGRDAFDSLDGSTTKAQSSRKTLLTSFLDVQSPDVSNGLLFYPSAK